ncbi:hypothetical protein O6H91_20G072600 [Diphasiastrum complanatum]|nr:hypothetical protein O6H91_20G072600 [Diphasiastrum complanatum]
MHLYPLASAALSLSQPEVIFAPPMAAMEAEKQPIRDDWNEVATFALLEAWGKKCMQLNRSNLKLEHWAQVAEMVTSKSKTHKTDVQCKNRVDTLKKKFKHEKQKVSMGGGSSKWPFFSVLEKLLDSTPKRGGGGGGLISVADAGQIVENISAFQMDGGKPSRQEEPKASASTGSGSKRNLGKYSSSAHGNVGNDVNGDHKSSKKRKEAPYRILAKAISKFGEIFEKIENSKQQQLRELEKIRMEFTRDLELQRMNLFMQTQVELAKLKHGGIDMDPSVSNMSG